MGAVGDDDDVVEVVFVGDLGEAVDLLLGVDGAGLGDDVAEGNAVGEEVVAADAALGLAGVLVAAAAEGDDDGSDLLAVEIDGVVEAGVEDGRGAAVVLGCTEDGDGVGGLGVVLVGDGVDLAGRPRRTRRWRRGEKARGDDGRFDLGECLGGADWMWRRSSVDRSRVIGLR